MKQLGTVWLQGLCCSGARAKPCTSALLSITRIQQNETNTISKSRCFLLDVLICNPTMPMRSMLMFSLLQALQGHARPLSRSHYAEYCVQLFFRLSWSFPGGFCSASTTE